jgi:hypothetical protein
VIFSFLVFSKEVSIFSFDPNTGLDVKIVSFLLWFLLGGICYYTFQQVKKARNSAKNPEAAATKWFIDTVADKWCKEKCGTSMTDLIKNI